MYFTYTLFTDILFIKSSRKTLQIFLKTPNSGHKMCEETVRNMWSCVFPFCNVQNYHGNLGFLSWNIIKKSLKFFEACLLESCTCVCVRVCIYIYIIYTNIDMQKHICIYAKPVKWKGCIWAAPVFLRVSTVAGANVSGDWFLNEIFLTRVIKADNHLAFYLFHVLFLEALGRSFTPGNMQYFFIGRHSIGETDKKHCKFHA